MDYLKYNIKDLVVFFLIAILMSIFLHLLSCDKNKKNNNNNTTSYNTFKNILARFNSSVRSDIEKFQDINNNIDDEILTKTILNSYKKYQNDNIINFRDVKSLDYDINNMKSRVKHVLDTLNSQYKKHYNKSVMFNTNGVITGA